jgi:hypothetical protein
MVRVFAEGEGATLEFQVGIDFREEPHAISTPPLKMVNSKIPTNIKGQD